MELQGLLERDAASEGSIIEATTATERCRTSGRAEGTYDSITMTKPLCQS